MIIAAYAGCGKTTFAKDTWNSIDLVSVPYKYDVTDAADDAAEESKADYGYELNRDWPKNYISAIVTAYHKYRYVVIPTIIPVLRELEKMKLPYVLCYPDRTLKEEYRQRYKERGNNMIFERVFADNWDRYIDAFESDAYGRHIKLESSEFLKDRRYQIEKITKETESVLQLSLDEILEEDIQRIFEETGICIEEHIRQFMIYIAEHPEIAHRTQEQITKNGRIDIAALSAEFYDRMVRTMRIDQAIYEAEEEFRNGGEAIVVEEAFAMLNEKYQGQNN